MLNCNLGLNAHERNSYTDEDSAVSYYGGPPSYMNLQRRGPPQRVRHEISHSAHYHLSRLFQSNCCLSYIFVIIEESDRLLIC